MSIRVLCIGDPHFTQDAYLEMDEFTKRTLELIDKFKSETSGLHLVVVLGDILDRFERAHLTIHTQAMKWLHLVSLKCRLLILIGNHDRINNNVFLSEESFFWACHHWPNVTVADTTKKLIINGFQFVGVPYVAPGRFAEALDKIEGWKESKAIFAHQEMKGCSLGIIRSELGDPWSNSYPLLISGHIHEYERLGKNIIYVGTPRMKTFGDHKEKTVSLFTFNSKGDSDSKGDSSSDSKGSKGDSRNNSDSKGDSSSDSKGDSSSSSSEMWKEDKFSLELPKKISVRLTVDQITTATDFLSLKDNLTGTLKIFVQGTAAELSIGLKHPIVKHLKSLGVKIVPEEIAISLGMCRPEQVENISRTELEKRIWDRLSDTPELFNIMKSLFGRVKLKI